MSSMLFDPRAHEPLVDTVWSPAEVEAAIRAIAEDADRALRPGDWWPWHPLDSEPGDPDVVHGIYLGAAGALWALDSLARAGLHEPGHDYALLAQDAYASYRRGPEFDGPLPSLWMGEGGIALVAWLLSPTQALADRLEEIVTAAPENDTQELMWGSPGPLLIADAMFERTGEERWASASSTIAERLMAEQNADGLWTQRLYGSTREYIGAAHGAAGVLAALARRPERLAPDISRGLEATAIRAAGMANWPPSLSEPLAKPDDGSIRTQWCHGAPGIVTSVAGLPGTEELLLAGGELTWAAGPPSKGAGLCHGSAGNGFALLKLFTQTGNEEWLHRARSFGMHSAAQVAQTREHHGRGRHTLWTGDLGTAMYLHQCLAGTSAMPTIDAW